MPKNATPSQHRPARVAVKRALQRRHRGIGMRAVMHITDEHNAHYDFTLYAPSDLTPKEVETAVKESWEIAGGLRATCKPLGSSETDDLSTGWSSYPSKGDDKERWRWVPLPLKDGGLPMPFGTHGFFGKGRTADSIHADWVAAHYPKQFKAVFLRDEWDDSDCLDSDDRETPPRTIRKISSPNLIPSDTKSTVSAASAWQELAGDKEEVIYSIGSLLQARVSEFLASHPDRVLIVPVKGSYTAPDPDTVLKSDLHTATATSPREAVAPEVLAERIGWDVEQIESALKNLPSFKRTHGLSADGILRHDLIHREVPRIFQPEQQEPVSGDLTPAEQAELDEMFREIDDA